MDEEVEFVIAGIRNLNTTPVPPVSDVFIEGASGSLLVRFGKAGGEAMKLCPKELRAIDQQSEGPVGDQFSYDCTHIESSTPLPLSALQDIETLLQDHHGIRQHGFRCWSLWIPSALPNQPILLGGQSKGQLVHLDGRVARLHECCDDPDVCLLATEYSHESIYRQHRSAELIELDHWVFQYHIFCLDQWQQTASANGFRAPVQKQDGFQAAYHHSGSPRQWLLIEPLMSSKFETFLGHQGLDPQTVFISASEILRAGISVIKVRQCPGDAIIVAPGTWFWYQDTGANVVETVQMIDIWISDTDLVFDMPMDLNISLNLEDAVPPQSTETSNQAESPARDPSTESDSGNDSPSSSALIGKKVLKFLNEGGHLKILDPTWAAHHVETKIREDLYVLADAIAGVDVITRIQHLRRSYTGEIPQSWKHVVAIGCETLMSFGLHRNILAFLVAKDYNNILARYRQTHKRYQKGFKDSTPGRKSEGEAKAELFQLHPYEDLEQMRLLGLTLHKFWERHIHPIFIPSSSHIPGTPIPTLGYTTNKGSNADAICGIFNSMVPDFPFKDEDSLLRLFNRSIRIGLDSASHETITEAVRRSRGLVTGTCDFTGLQALFNPCSSQSS